MTTIVLNAETSGLSLGHLLQQAVDGGVQVQDASGKTVALLMSPADKEALTYLEAILELERNKDKVRAAAARRGGITTAELLRRAHAADGQ